MLKEIDVLGGVDKSPMTTAVLVALQGIFGVRVAYRVRKKMQLMAVSIEQTLSVAPVFSPARPLLLLTYSALIPYQ